MTHGPRNNTPHYVGVGKKKARKKSGPRHREFRWSRGHSHIVPIYTFETKQRNTHTKKGKNNATINEKKGVN